MTTTVLMLGALGVALLVVLWAIQLRTEDAATADIGWTILVGGGAIAAAVLVEGDAARRMLVAVLVVIWAARLGGHLLLRLLSGEGEDSRYRTLRNHWGDNASRNYLGLYLIQAVFAAAFLAPIVVAMRAGPIDAWAVAGVVIWMVAVAGEWLADHQLARFRADPATRGTVCRDGLWRYSRHPNFFFEWVHWWAYVAIGHAAPLTFLGPAFMLLLLFRVTGIPHVERQALRSRGDAYRRYQQTTSVFIPLPPREQPS